MNIQFEKEVCAMLQIPSIPLKEWNKKDSFKIGVAVTRLACEHYAYAACTFDEEVDEEPRITKVFAQEPFYGIENIYVVPEYMDTNVENADLDEQSKANAQKLVEEAEELTKEDGVDVVEESMKDMEKLPEWVFPEINSLEEAIAWLRNYNSRNGIRGKVPENEETVKLRLLNIHSQIKEQEENEEGK